MKTFLGDQPRLDTPSLGAFSTTDGTTFRLWSTLANEAEVRLYWPLGAEERRPLDKGEDGIFQATFPDVCVCTRYEFVLDGKPLPDPYARRFPRGISAPAAVWRPSYRFVHRSPQLRADELIIYEMHVGTFTPQGTWRAASAKLGHLKDLGITCIEMMPISEFAGSHGWGYDGVAHFAPYHGYGRPEDLQAFIDAAHGLGIAVILDLVLNHFGPAGNYLSSYSPEYFTEKHCTPWGAALDYTNPYMRRLALEAAAHWFRHYRFDGFRLDATHQVYDDSTTHVLAELVESLRATAGVEDRPCFLFAEDDRNWPGLIRGVGMDGVWADDFHHQARVLLTGERDGYYVCYPPRVDELADCIRDAWKFQGQPWPLDGHPRGAPADELVASNFVYTIQNHDQIGNRATGDRLQVRSGEDGFLAAGALLLFLPMTPLIFQGQEWMASTPFQYFSDHEEPLGSAITRGRTSEFNHFDAFREGKIQVPDPQSPQTFQASKLNWDEIGHGVHGKALSLFQKLIALRKSDPVLRHASRADMLTGAIGNVLWVERRHEGRRRLLLVNFGQEQVNLAELGSDFATNFKPLLATHEQAGEILPDKSAMILTDQ
jgi:maltooligosyltrehalose trehalohydrolase